MNKKIIFAATFLLFFAGARAWKCVDCPREYFYGMDELGGRNYLPDMAARLENKHNIFTCIKLDNSRAKYDLNEAAYACLTNAAAEAPDKGILVIYVDNFRKKGVIRISDGIKPLFPEKYIRALQDDVLNNLQGKWYLRQVTLLTKITGSFVYLLEKTTMDKKDAERLRARMIRVDDPVYGISLLPMINDMIGLFYMEPLTFMFYFPFVMYFLIVRWIGMKFGQTGFIVSNAAWLAFMVFSGALIMNRLNIYFPDYVSLFLVVSGFNIPFYTALYGLYSNKISAAASTYISEVTGGFDAVNSFEGKKWGR